jgi:ABC transporter substrate binding protein (PQQ-dependent alcohol dehydrogenase system)
VIHPGPIATAGRWPAGAAALHGRLHAARWLRRLAPWPWLAAVATASAANFKVTLLVPADDARLERARVERAAPGHPSGPPADALKVALAEGKVELDAAGSTLALQVVEVADAGAARNAAAQAEKQGAAALVTDLPATWTLAAADAVKIPLLNAGQGADALRQADCRRHLWHTAPSDRMKADALAQFLAARRWQQVLLLAGPSADDAVRSAAAQAAIKRYGLKLVAVKPFRLSADPRERDLANPLLLTGPAVGAYDVVWVFDSDGEFATTLPFRTGLPRPVVGDGGLSALAWHPRFDRFGAPQVTRRLAKAAGRPMGAHDWSLWIAGKALVAAAVGASRKPADFAAALAGAEIDGSKGVAMGFRPWDGQLRQTLLLGDAQAVAAQAPTEGVLHSKNTQDTLGADAPEKLCKARS